MKPLDTSSFERKLLAYSAAAGVALAAVPDANAQAITDRGLAPVLSLQPSAPTVIDLDALSSSPPSDPTVSYTDFDPDFVANTAGGIFLFDFDGDTYGDIGFIVRTRGGGGGNLQALVYDFNTGQDEFVIGSTGAYYQYGALLSYGATVSTGNNFGGPFVVLGEFFGGVPYGQWLGGSGYLGFRLNLDDGAGGTNRFNGWFNLEVSAAADQIIIKEVAFETVPFEAINAATVPVELTNFDAVLDGEAVVLNWATASETVNAGFEVQMRSENQANFQPLEFVEGAGTTTEAQAYSFRVGDLQPGTYAFRLKQVDFDGAFEYSAEVEATVTVLETHVLSEVYPNPFAQQATLDLAVREAQDVRVEVFNMVGQRVATLLDGAMEANVSTPVTLDAAGLPGGLYLVRVTGESFQTTRKVTITN